MKKAIVLFMAAATALSFTGCAATADMADDMVRDTRGVIDDAIDGGRIDGRRDAAYDGTVGDGTTKRNYRNDNFADDYDINGYNSGRRAASDNNTVTNKRANSGNRTTSGKNSDNGSRVTVAEQERQKSIEDVQRTIAESYKRHGVK